MLLSMISSLVSRDSHALLDAEDRLGGKVLIVSGLISDILKSLTVAKV